MTKKVESAKSDDRIVATHRKARFDYEVLDTLEAGLVLLGSEVKSLRQGKATLQDSYAAFLQNELCLFQCRIEPYPQAGPFNHAPLRPRKLLLHKTELTRLKGKLQEKGLTLVPLKLYFKRGKAKVQLALVRGKKQFDKREAIKQRETQREIQRAIKRR